MGTRNALGRVYLQDVDTSMTAARRTMFMARSVLGRREESRRTHSSLPSYVCLQPDSRQGAGRHPIVARAGTTDPLYLDGNEDEVKACRGRGQHLIRATFQTAHLRVEVFAPCAVDVFGGIFLRRFGAN